MVFGMSDYEPPPGKIVNPAYRKAIWADVFVIADGYPPDVESGVEGYYSKEDRRKPLRDDAVFPPPFSPRYDLIDGVYHQVEPFIDAPPP